MAFFSFLRCNIIGVYHQLILCILTSIGHGKFNRIWSKTSTLWSFKLLHFQCNSEHFITWKFCWKKIIAAFFRKYSKFWQWFAKCESNRIVFIRSHINMLAENFKSILNALQMVLWCQWGKKNNTQNKLLFSIGIKCFNVWTRVNAFWSWCYCWSIHCVE